MVETHATDNAMTMLGLLDCWQ